MASFSSTPRNLHDSVIAPVDERAFLKAHSEVASLTTMIGSADCDMPIVATCPRFCSGTTELRSGWCRRARYWDCSTTAAYRPYTTFVPLSRNPPSGKAPDLGSGNPV